MNTLQLLCLQTLSRNPSWKEKISSLPTEITNVVLRFYTERFLIENEEDLLKHFFGPNLTKITLRDYFITGMLLKSLALMIVETSFKSIATNVSLIQFNLIFLKCHSLQSLECFYIDASHCPIILSTVGKSLKSLHFTNCTGVTDSLLETISKHCSNLESFFLGITSYFCSVPKILTEGCKELTEPAIISVLRANPKLR
jgi:hypothetical protein